MATLWVLFFAGWGVAVWRMTVYFAKKEDLDKNYHQVDPNFMRKP